MIYAMKTNLQTNPEVVAISAYVTFQLHACVYHIYLNKKHYENKKYDYVQEIGT
jgi:hypothetical protein